ncbi:hypothetical protein Taro_039370 [Colocasia esculenta]|uniref:tRNA pseudouridine synthase n=1 Tax=Colocasia esculenta TaxID=4460 RepID=A0A843WFL0_COLES|nr:hypothetical protein [Colocasia esculenta]
MHRPDSPAASQLEAKRPADPPSPSSKPAKIQKSGEEEEEARGGEGVGCEDGCQLQVTRKMSQKNPGIQRYLVAVEYIGTRFSGSQQQLNCRTVVGVLEEAFRKFIGQPVSIFCSSRTDAGVHALSNVCHVDVERISKRKPGEVLPPHEPWVVRRAVNHFLQKNEGDITVVDVRCVPADFHARFKARERTYFYRLLSGPEPLSTFEKERAWHVPEELDVQAMQKACDILVGSHDFSSFRAAGCQASSPIKTLDELHICEVFPFLYFPSAMERERMHAHQNSPLTSPPQSASATDAVIGRLGRNQEFGQRKRHRCYVITARARSFLYHQGIKTRPDRDQIDPANLIWGNLANV